MIKSETLWGSTPQSAAKASAQKLLDAQQITEGIIMKQEERNKSDPKRIGELLDELKSNKESLLYYIYHIEVRDGKK